MTILRPKTVTFELRDPDFKECLHYFEIICDFYHGTNLGAAGSPKLNHDLDEGAPTLVPCKHPTIC